MFVARVPANETAPVPVCEKVPSMVELPAVKIKLPLLAMEKAPPFVVINVPLMSKFVPVN